MACSAANPRGDRGDVSPPIILVHPLQCLRKSSPKKFSHQKLVNCCQIEGKVHQKLLKKLIFKNFRLRRASDISKNMHDALNLVLCAAIHPN